jgi:type IV pilus assembly protein PilA
MALAGMAFRAHYSGAPGGGEPLGAPSRPGGTQVTSRRGFTLIELLIVVVIIGLLAAIAIPKFSNTKEKAYVAAMKSDLRNLATAEEAFFYDSAKYTTSFALMGNFLSSAGVVLVINEATPSGWSATTTSLYAPGRQCALFSGAAAPVAPATSEGRITCQ